MALKKGKKVMIYVDPVTCKTKEGKAFLRKRIQGGDVTEFWRVRFIDDDFSTARWVNKKIH